MHEMLQMFGRDKDSETGSFTDSGRGPSEEGDTRPSPLDPKLNDDHKGTTQKSNWTSPSFFLKTETLAAMIAHLAVKSST